MSTSSKPLFISAYTPRYELEAAGLIASLDAHGLRHSVEPYESRGRWERNCAYKATYIERKLDEHDGPVCWIDADARVVRRPSLLFLLDCDLAAHWNYGKELLSGTLYVGNTQAARELVKRWRILLATCPEKWDQRALAETIKDHGAGLDIVDLPAEYTWIFDCERQHRRAGTVDPVIVHYQASRRLRK